MTTEGLKPQKQWQFLSLTGESIAAAAGPSTMRGEPESRSTAHTERDEYIMMIPASLNLNQVRVSDESEAIVQT